MLMSDVVFLYFYPFCLLVYEKLTSSKVVPLVSTVTFICSWFLYKAGSQHLQQGKSALLSEFGT